MSKIFSVISLRSEDLTRATMWTILAGSFLLASSAIPAETLSATTTLKIDVGQPNPKAEDMRFSGAACDVFGGQRHSCLLAGDEFRYAQLFTFDDRKLLLGKRVYLLPQVNPNPPPGANAEFDETDAEGVAFDDNYYYLVGSHGRNKRGEQQPSRYFVYRIKIDGATGLPNDYGTSKKASGSVERSSVLASELKKASVFNSEIHGDPSCGALQTSAHQTPLELAPEQNGVNIEGLAVTDGQLHFGFRGPFEKTGAFIGTLNASAVFDHQEPHFKLEQVQLGDCQAVRDLAAVQGGVLILSGPQSRQSGAASIFFWKPGSEAQRLADLNQTWSGGAQPETLMVIKDDTDRYSVLVTQDGDNNGPPATYQIPKPRN
ncbi:DUF3616 domain-containing protein [Rhizobium rhizogenes]|uniref:DUF3616 domain-containing protein n=1 Tax=Rhizobium rhizogenes TaxID=359 RepID=UPI00080FFEAA|nr:DUF3616 domain-containing protein [Rhizobium rhizogenes]NTI44228.1 DUF3616 domain-containing protein [Rhizobium rhizogenes]OCJ19855.1 hypothetical protein A6U88_32925 [Agrobacterium sp. B131/95]